MFLINEVPLYIYIYTYIYIYICNELARISGEGLDQQTCPAAPDRQKELVIDNLLVRIHFVIVMIEWTGLAPWEF